MRWLAAVGLMFALFGAMMAGPTAADASEYCGSEELPQGYCYPLPIEDCLDGEMVCCPEGMGPTPYGEGESKTALCTIVDQGLNDHGFEECSDGTVKGDGPCPEYDFEPGSDDSYMPRDYAYIINTDGDGANCRTGPGWGAALTAIPEGAEVGLIDYPVDGYQLVVSQYWITSCYVLAEFLGSIGTAPTVPESGSDVDTSPDLPEIDAPEEVAVVEQNSSGQTGQINTSVSEIEALPVTGVGKTSSGWNYLPFAAMSTGLLIVVAILAKPLAKQVADYYQVDQNDPLGHGDEAEDAQHEEELDQRAKRMRESSGRRPDYLSGI